jgi:hypothetical protein
MFAIEVIHTWSLPSRKNTLPFFTGWTQAKSLSIVLFDKLVKIQNITKGNYALRTIAP